MITALKTLVRHNDNLYLVIRKIPISYFEQGGQTNVKVFNLWKEYLKSDHVLKIQDHYVFCETINEAEVVED